MNTIEQDIQNEAERAKQGGIERKYHHHAGLSPPLGLVVLLLVVDFIKVVVCEAEHLDQGTEEQDVTAHVQLQLFTVVLYWDNAGHGYPQTATHLLGLWESGHTKHYQTLPKH